MKIKLALAAILFCICFSQLNAQTQTRKGHFLLTTNLLDYSLNSSRSVNTATPIGGTSPVTQDSTHNKFSTLSLSFNVYAGYFISNKVCLGFGMNTVVNADPYMTVPNTTYATFFRYYLNKADSAGFDFYLEGNLGAGFATTTTSEDFTGNGNGTSQTTNPYTNTASELYGSIGVCASYHITPHWNIGVVAAFTFTTLKESNGAYTTTENNNGAMSSTTYEASTASYLESSEHFKLRLEYYL
jgi:hypothetical protein